MKNSKKIDENIYNEKSLYLLNIRELRDLGRKLGVPAPATLKKQDLVDYILKIVYGEVVAPKRNSCGRPNVREVNINDYIAKIKKKSDIDDEIINASLDEFDLNFKVASFKEENFISEVKQRIFVEDNGKCYLRKYGFVESDDDIEISKSIKDKFNLSNFDVVEAIISGKSFKIVSVNGENVKNEKENENDKLGTKQVFHLCTKEEIKNNIDELIKKNCSCGLKTIVFSTEKFDGEKVQSIVADKSESNSVNYKTIISFIEMCEKCIFDGETIVVVTDESTFIEDVFEQLDSEISARTKKFLQTKINELLSLGNELVILKLDENAIYQ